MALQLYVGQTHLRGAISKYASRFNLLELRADTGRLPRCSVLQRWREEVPDKFVFSLLLDREIGRFTEGYEAKLDEAILAAQALSARWMVLQTDPTVGPSHRSRQRLTSLFSRLAQTGTNVAWEPHGVWQDDEAAVYAREFGVQCVRDISRGEPTNEEVIYSRMPGLGTSARLSAGALEKTVRSLAKALEAYIVVGGDGARKLQQLLPSLVGNLPEEGIKGAVAFRSVEVFGGFTSPGACADSDIEEESYDEDIDEDAVDLDEEALAKVEVQARTSDDDDECEDDDPLEGEVELTKEPSGSSKRARVSEGKLSSKNSRKEFGRR